MIGHLALAVGADLSRRKFPHPVRYAPEHSRPAGFDHAIVFVRDRQAGDSIVAAVGAKDRNPEVPFNRLVSGVVTIYARSPKPGATVLDHEDVCDETCDAVLAAMYRILKVKRLPLQIVESRLLGRAELRDEDDQGDDRSGQRSADWTGCAARIRFKVATAVRDITYKGEAQATAVIDDVDCPVVTSEGFDDYDPAPGDPP